MPEYRFDNKALKERRIASGKKPELIALNLDITKEAYIAYETGRSLPPTPRLFQLCTELECRPEELLVPIEPAAQVAARSGRRSRREQGLTEQVEDPAALDAAAELLRA